jgi:hypothetical protein
MPGRYCDLMTITLYESTNLLMVKNVIGFRIPSHYNETRKKWKTADMSDRLGQRVAAQPLDRAESGAARVRFAPAWLARGAGGGSRNKKPAGGGQGIIVRGASGFCLAQRGLHSALAFFLSIHIRPRGASFSGEKIFSIRSFRRRSAAWRDRARAFRDPSRPCQSDGRPHRVRSH